VEGLSGASRAFFLASLEKQIPSAPIAVLTGDQNTGETLLSDLKYFFRFENIKIEPRFFPTWELLPYEPLSPLSEISGERLTVLHRLQKGERLFLVVPLEALMQFVMPRSVLNRLVFPVRQGDSLGRDLLETCLADNGYSRVNLVEGRGEFSVRGDIVDVFLPASSNPVRIEFFGDEVESIRVFDAMTQVSMDNFREIQILPVREVCPTPDEAERAIEKILLHGRDQGVDRHALRELTEKIQHLGSFAGIEHLAPFFYPGKETLFDYLPPETVWVVDEVDRVREKGRQYHEMILAEYEGCMEREDVAPLPENFYLNYEELERRLESFSNLHLNTLKLTENGAPHTCHFDLKPTPPFRGQFESFAEQVMAWEEAGLKVSVIASTKGQVRRVLEFFDEYGLSLGVDQGYISFGFQFPDAGRVFVAEHEIFGRTHKHRHRRKPRSQSFQRGFKDLKPGDFLVHVDYGIGRYEGTRELETGGGGEFLEIAYADQEKLYIPMDGLGYIQKYLGSGDLQPALSKLGSVSWKRQKEKVKNSIREMAEDLLKLYAQREVIQGKSYPPNPISVQEFADSFEYVETEDQLKAIEEVEEDLEGDKPMDRLICGDVGYGKTEVAMRAAFKVVLEKKQVAILVPTTILAQQHLLSFQERFRSYPMNIDCVSRFRSPGEQKRILEKLKRGEIDIIIGTHRLLSRDVKFADLGLIVIDEEQRFGVKHKEQLKKLRTSVDILTLTATPIPRTLHFSLMGVRDLSVIETPPSDRLAIKTFIRKFDEKVIREAILRELDREGQIFFVHNKVHSIHSMAEMIREIVPQVRLGIAHGQLPEKQLEKVMRQFIDREIDLLLATTIVESGLDIPSANTIIINRADQFGLAQLYQLRGRVGRYKHQAYAYLLIPGAMAISEDARMRITAIEEMSELGSGFQLAARDMEIRGVGNMLGHDQSGHINSIGFDLYSKLIEETVKELKGEKIEAPVETEMDFQVRGFIPKNYIPELNQRLEIYRRIQLIREPGEGRQMERELTDRYGALPEPALKLLALVEFKTLFRKLHITRAVMKGGRVFLNIDPSTPLAPEKITPLLDGSLTFVSEFQLGIKVPQKGWKADLDAVKHYLQRIMESHEFR